MGIVGDIIIILIAALMGSVVARLTKQPLIIGYLLAGVVSGPHTGFVMVSNAHEIGRLAEVGVALVLLAVKLKLSVNVR